ncbi:MAG: HEAT repeat domain-containing protein [Pseudomonadota bacterium]
MKSVTCMLYGLCVLAATASACTVSSNDIAKWKETEKGPRKIRAAIRDKRQRFEIRTEAAMAMLELKLYGPLGDDLEAVGGDREKISGVLVGQLKDRMNDDSVSPKAQQTAKDALFGLLPALRGKMRQTSEEALLRWVVADWEGRRFGEHSATKIVQSIGRNAGPILAESLTNDPKSVHVLADLLGQIGSESDRDIGASKLLELAKTKNTENVFRALGQVGSPKARAYLLQVAENGSERHRIWALLALKMKPHAFAVRLAGKLAGDPFVSAAIRSAAIEVLEAFDSKDSAQALALLLEDKDKTVRYRAVEALVICCKAMGVAKVLRGLPGKYGYKKEDVVDFVEGDIAKIGKDALIPLRAALMYENWIARVVAVRLLGRLGDKEDLPAMGRLVYDVTQLRGWGGRATVGSETRIAVAELKKRLQVGN